MAVSLKGADKLMQKLSQFSSINTKKMVSQSARKITEALRNEASQFSESEYQYIAEVEERDYGLSYFCDVGLKNDSAPFDSWKGLYFHNYGYANMGLGGIFHGKYVSMHINWFELAVKSVEKEVLRDIKGKLQKEIRALNNV